MATKTRYQDATQAQISKDRIRLGNQYAHVAENGDYEALVPVKQPLNFSVDRNPRYKNKEIKEIVRLLHREIWKNKEHIYIDHKTINPIELLNPEPVLQALGYVVNEEETLGVSSNGDEVAGAIDAKNKIIYISKRFSPKIRRFTLAHELSHALMHQNHGLHRDKPIDGNSFQDREPQELEADKFASLFLMPEKLLKEYFHQYYLGDKFALNEETAFALIQKDLKTAQDKFNSRRDLSIYLAGNTQYNQKRFVSLADLFKVSITAMAIRLEEIGCV